MNYSSKMHNCHNFYLSSNIFISIQYKQDMMIKIISIILVDLIKHQIQVKTIPIKIGSSVFEA